MEIRRYITEAAEDVFGEWLAALADKRVAAKVAGKNQPLGGGQLRGL